MCVIKYSRVQYNVKTFSFLNYRFSTEFHQMYQVTIQINPRTNKHKSLQNVFLLYAIFLLLYMYFIIFFLKVIVSVEKLFSEH